MFVPDVPEAFAKAGINALTLDPRNTGASEGSPRQEINPYQQISDLSDALSFLRRQPTYRTAYNQHRTVDGHSWTISEVVAREKSLDLPQVRLPSSKMAVHATNTLLTGRNV